VGRAAIFLCANGHKKTSARSAQARSADKND
jgi:hypothetical protein